jgi:hypothetical protein
VYVDIAIEFIRTFDLLIIMSELKSHSHPVTVVGGAGRKTGAVDPSSVIVTLKVRKSALLFRVKLLTSRS